MSEPDERINNLRPKGEQMTNLLDNTDLPPEVDPNKDYLAELVGDGKKFKTSQDLARGKFEADQYIEVLKRRQDEMRADYLKISEESKTRATLDDLVKRLENRSASNDEPDEK